LFILICLVGDIPRALTAFVFLSQLPAWFMEAGRVMGGMLLMYCAGRAVSAPPSARMRFENRGVSRAAVEPPRSLAMRFLDPIPYLLWATVIGPLLVAVWRQEPIWALAFLGGLYGAVICGGTLVVLLVLTWRKRGPRLVAVLSWFCIAMVVVLAMLQLWAGTQAVATRFHLVGL